MFMVYEEVSLERVWIPWFSLAEDLVPRSSIAASGQGNTHDITAACRASRSHSSGNIISRQHLFSVYVHVPLGAEGTCSL